MFSTISSLDPPSLEIAGGWTIETLCFHHSVASSSLASSSTENCSVAAAHNPTANAVGSQTLHLWYPADPDIVVDHQLEQGNEADPFWCYLWPTARTLAQQVLTNPHSRSQRVLETGCGIGLVGLAALAAGAERVTFEDLRSPSVELALHNAQCNGFSDRAQGRVAHWSQPPPGQFDWILASDVLYHQSTHESLLRYLRDAIAPNGVIWIGDPGRKEAAVFLQHAQKHFDVEHFDAHNAPISDPLQGQFQRFVLR